MRSNSVWAVLVAVLTGSFVLSPLASTGFNGFTPGQFPVVAERWPVQPVPWAFSIWGVIYLALILGAMMGLLRYRAAPAWGAMRPPLAASLGLGTFWIAVANVQPVAATAMIIFMAAMALAALLRAPETFWAEAPVGLYAGWLTAATGVAMAVVMSGYGIMSAQLSALIFLGLILVAGFGILWLRPAPAFAFGLGWALMGVMVANLTPLNLPVLGLAGSGLAGVAALALWRRRR